MLRGLLLYAAACAAPTTAFAGDRDQPLVPNLRALLAADAQIILAASRAEPMARARAASFLPIAYHGLERADRPVLHQETIALPVRLQTRFSLDALDGPTSWQLTGAAADAKARANPTSARGGSWAVYDTLAQQRKPRFRQTPMSTMLVLRIDGKEDSPPISVGGGGVAAALWRVMPGN